MKKSQRKGEKLIQRTIRIEGSLWHQARVKAGHHGLSAVIRQLVQQWLTGKIKIDLDK